MTGDLSMGRLLILHTFSQNWPPIARPGGRSKRKEPASLQVLAACQRSPIAMKQWGFKHEKNKEQSPHVLIQSMRTSFCIYRLINRQNIGHSYQIWAVDARSGLFGVILPDGGFHFPALFSLIIPIFRGRNQRFIKKCTLLWTIAGYRPQCKVSSKVSKNSV